MEAIIDYLRERDPEVAQRFVSSVRTTFEHISHAPASYPRYESTNPRLASLRKRPLAGAFHKYVVFYRYDETSIDVIRVLHCARDIPRLLTEP